MWGLEKILNSNDTFIGVISSNDPREERKPFESQVESYFNNGGGMVYISCKDEEDKSIDYLNKILGLDVNYLIKKGSIVVVCKKNFVLENNIDIHRLMETIERGVSLLDKNGFNKKQVYITLDSCWHSVGSNNIKHFYDSLKTMNRLGKAGFILRYIIDEFNEDYIKYILDNHDFILVDRINSFEYYTPTQLLHQSLILLAGFHTMDDRYEKEVMRNEYLRTLGELMESTVHDINNLLVIILGYVQLSLFLNDADEIKEYLQIISKTALDGKCITDRIKNYIKGSYDSLKDIWEPLKDVHEFNHIIKNGLDMVKHKIKLLNKDNKNMDLVVELNSKSYIYGNEYDIRHSVINIILNGIEAIENKGVLTIRTYDEEDNIILEISDTGKGMDETTKSKIFKPYFTTKGSQGTGLGLSIAKKTFERHNGKIYVESKVGEGTRFTILLPALRIKDNVAHV